MHPTLPRLWTRGLAQGQGKGRWPAPRCLPSPVAVLGCSRYRCTAANPAEFYNKSIEEYAKIQPHNLHIDYALKFGQDVTPEKLIHSAEYVRQELPVRLARSIRSFQTLPYIVAINPHVHSVYSKFCHAFQVLTAIQPITDLEKERAFTAALTNLFQETSEVITELSSAIKEIRRLPVSLGINYAYLDAFIDNFLLQRISRRVLVEYHVGLHSKREDWVGVFQMHTSPAALIDHVMPIAQETCFSLYRVFPSYQIVGDVDATLPYVPVHLESILLEVFKNALRAVVEKHHNRRRSAALPPVKIRICAGGDVTIIVQDQGGGIDEEGMRHIWSYGYTTWEPSKALHVTDTDGGIWQDFQRSVQTGQSTANQFAGYGFGLPITRVYSRYLGGDVEMVTMPGFGTDVYIRLKPVDRQRVTEKAYL